MVQEEEWDRVHSLRYTKVPKVGWVDYARYPSYTSGTKSSFGGQFRVSIITGRVGSVELFFPGRSMLLSDWLGTAGVQRQAVAVQSQLAYVLRVPLHNYMIYPLRLPRHSTQLTQLTLTRHHPTARRFDALRHHLPNWP